jgi:hypothetical protein
VKEKTPRGTVTWIRKQVWKLRNTL